VDVDGHGKALETRLTGEGMSSGRSPGTAERNTGSGKDYAAERTEIKVTEQEP
jgi:hypothetical protein